MISGSAYPVTPSENSRETQSVLPAELVKIGAIQGMASQGNFIQGMTASQSWQALIDAAPDFLWVKDINGVFIVANTALALAYGRASAAEMIGLSDFDIHPPKVAAEMFATEQEIIRSGVPSAVEDCDIDIYGAVRWLASTKAPLRNEQGETIGLVGIARNITEKRRAENWRAGLSEVLELIAAHAPLRGVLARLVTMLESQLLDVACAVVITDADGAGLRLGIAPGLAAPYDRLVTRVTPTGEESHYDRVIRTRAAVMVADMASHRTPDAVFTILQGLDYRSCWSVPIESHRGESLGALSTYSRKARLPRESELQLLTECQQLIGIVIGRWQSQARIRYLASHDTLTSLMNRSVLQERLGAAIRQALSEDRWAVAIFIDLDSFKPINDTLGHSAGDTLLVMVAERIRAALRADDVVIRYGGDEFLVIQSDQPKDRAIVAGTVQRLRQAIAEPMPLAHRQVRISCSVGVAICPEDSSDAEALVAQADAAMYRAKAGGPDSFTFYSDDMLR